MIFLKFCGTVNSRCCCLEKNEKVSLHNEGWQQVMDGTKASRWNKNIYMLHMCMYQMYIYVC